MKLPFRSRHLMGIFPHPDDESYGSGGTFALCAKGGAKTTIVCATRGEAGLDLSKDPVVGPAFAERRTNELCDACKRLGASPPLFLDLPDAGLAKIPESELTARLDQVLSQQRPDVVVTLGWDGVYGHADHIAITQSTVKALAAWPSARRPRLLLVAFPRGLFTPVRRSFKRHAPELLADVQMDETPGIERSKAELIVDISAVADMKRQAIAAHASQYRNGDVETFLYPGLIDNLMDEELFVVAAGPPLPLTSAHPFSGLP